LNAANDVTAKYFSDLLGKSTVKVETGSESKSHSKEDSTSKSDSYSYTSRSLMTADEIMRMPDTQSLLIFSNQRPVRATKAFQFKLFPNVDSLVKLAQNDYQGQMALSQQVNFKKLNDKWQAELTKRKSINEKNDMSEEEEADVQDELDQVTFSNNNHETKTDDVFL